MYLQLTSKENILHCRKVLLIFLTPLSQKMIIFGSLMTCFERSYILGGRIKWLKENHQIFCIRCSKLYSKTSMKQKSERTPSNKNANNEDEWKGKCRRTKWGNIFTARWLQSKNLFCNDKQRTNFYPRTFGSNIRMAFSPLKCVCVSGWERERERERLRKKEREGGERLRY